MRVLFAIFLAFMLSSCALKPKVEKSEALLVTFKTKKIAYRDTGFLKTAPNYANLQIFAMGNILMDLTLNDSGVCVNSYCVDKESFNRKYLSKYYPDNLLENVLKGKPIFNGANMQETESGFIQKIKEDGKYDITYKVSNGKILFKDRLNRIIIALKPIKS